MPSFLIAICTLLNVFIVWNIGFVTSWIRDRLHFVTECDKGLEGGQNMLKWLGRHSCMSPYVATQSHQQVISNH